MRNSQGKSEPLLVQPHASVDAEHQIHKLLDEIFTWNNAEGISNLLWDMFIMSLNSTDSDSISYSDRAELAYSYELISKFFKNAEKIHLKMTA